MSTYPDQRGVAHTAASQDAVDRFDATVTEYVHFSTETGARLKETLRADAEFPMAHVLRGYFMQLFCVASLREKAKQSLAKAREVGADAGISEREQHHVEALEAWIAGDLDTALARALLGERTRLKPDNAWSWRRYAEALEAVGDHAAAGTAAERARSLLAS